MINIIRKTKPAQLPTKFGRFKVIAYEDDSKKEHLAIIAGDVKGKSDVIVRIHSQCITGDALGSLRCDCGEQLERSLKRIDREGGVLIYLAQEGRGIGLLNKIDAYTLQDKGADTVEANVKLGHAEDARDYSSAALMLKDLGVKSIKLLTNNPHKIDSIKKCGIIITERLSLIVPATCFTKKYLQTKKEKMGHQL